VYQPLYGPKGLVIFDHPYNGGSARVLQNLAITQCDALRKLAGVRPVVDGPASPERHGARFGGVRMGSAARPGTGKPAPGLACASARTRASTCADRDLPGSPFRSCPP